MNHPQETDRPAPESKTPVTAKKAKYSDPYFSRKAVIYFIAAGSNPVKAVKIGVTARNKVHARLRSIQTANHERVELLKVIEFLGDEKPGLKAEQEEAKLHEKFSKLQRAKGWTVGCEWFNWEEPLISYIKELHPLPDDLQPQASQFLQSQGES